MKSTSSSSGGTEIILTFAAGTDADTAQVQVQNKVQQALSLLPDTVQRLGVQVSKAVDNSFMNNDIYLQIALLTIIGLSAKNSILIVEFARELHRGGKDLVAATVEASRLRLRPIIMTSLCFILGVVPLALSSGAGSGAQNALGTAVLTGMITATGLGIYYTPLFFIVVTRFFSGSGTAHGQTRRGHLWSSLREYLHLRPAKKETGK